MSKRTTRAEKRHAPQDGNNRNASDDRKATTVIEQSQAYRPTADEQATIEKALERRNIPAPRLKVEDDNLFADHPHPPTGELLLANALGSLDKEFVSGLIRQLVVATCNGSKNDEDDLNFSISVIKGIGPADQLESLLASQMTVVHMAIMRLSGELGTAKSHPQQEAACSAINKFARTFAAQMESLKRYRSRGDQNDTVVSVSEGSQAIVGNVTQNRQEAAPINATPQALTHSSTPPIDVLSVLSPQGAAVFRKKVK
jgi:hypothetical protein